MPMTGGIRRAALWPFALSALLLNVTHQEIGEVVNGFSPGASGPEPARARIIIKYRQDLVEALPSSTDLSDLLRRSSLELATGFARAASLDELNQRFALRDSSPLLPGFANNEGAADRVERIRARFPSRASPGLVGEVPSGLGRVHVLELGAGVDIDGALNAYGRDPNVEYVHRDRLVHVQTVPDDPYFHSSSTWGQAYPDLWGLKAIRAAEAWDLSTGNPDLTVAVVDSGIDRGHVDIRDNLWVNPDESAGDANGDDCPGLCGIDDDGDGRVDEDSAGREPGHPAYTNDLKDDDDENGYADDLNGWDFTTCSQFAGSTCAVAKPPDGDPEDGLGHGTHVAGTIAAVGDNAEGIAGVLWQARIMALKGLNDFGEGSISDLAAALVYAADNGASILNNSWASIDADATPAVLREAIDYAHALGCVIVAAAGNDDTDVGKDDYGFYPASLDKVIAVSAFDPNDVKVHFSNWGSKVDVAAPGGGSRSDPDVAAQPTRNILSLRAEGTGDPELRVGPHYLRKAGTSMAAPHVAGIAGLILSRQPSLTNDLVRMVLRVSSDDVAEPGFDIQSGHGRVNAYEALKVADRLVFEQPAELLINALEVSPRLIVPHRETAVTVTVSNVGISAARQIPVELFDGQTNVERLLRRWTIPVLEAGDSERLEATVSFEELGNRRVVAVVNREAQVTELVLHNNQRGVDLDVLPYLLIEHRLTREASLRSEPAISGNRIVWTDDRSGRETIYLYDLGTDGRYGSTDDSGEVAVRVLPTQQAFLHKAPDISGHRIVWEDFRSGQYDIYQYDLGSDGLAGTSDDNGETLVVGDRDRQQRPVVSGSRIAWEDKRHGNWDIFLNRGSLQVTHATTRQRQVDISGTRLVWKHWGNGEVEIRLYDLGPDLIFGSGDDSERPLSRGPEFRGHPAISGNRIVWEDSRNGNVDIYLYDLGPDGRHGTADDSGEVQLTSDPGPQLAPAISGRRVVWTDLRNGNEDIFLYDLGPDGLVGTADDLRDIPLTFDLSSQYSPAISDRHVTWIDLRGGVRQLHVMTIAHHAPVLSPIGHRRIRAGQLLEIEVQGHDPDGTEVSFHVERRPKGATFRRIDASLSVAGDFRPTSAAAASWLFRWLPGESQIGEHEVRFSVRDGDPSEPLVDRETVIIHVLPRVETMARDSL